MKMLGKTQYNKGVTLIEVLVTTIVLAFGLLGLAGLQANALRNNQSAYQRSQATYLSYEMMDRMRANRIQAVDNGSYNIALGDAASGTSLADTDLAGWKASLAAVLPSGDGAVACVNATDICTVTVQWDDTRGAGAALSLTMSAEL